MQFKKPTVLFIVAIIGLITVYDVWAVSKGYEWTISSTLGLAGHQWPVIPFLVGLLCGHLWFANRADGGAGEVKK